MRTIRIGPDGVPRLGTDGAETGFDFNQYYHGFFPACRWTSAGSGKLLYLAGTDAKGLPHLFSSRSGEVWTEMNIRPRMSLLQPECYGDIVSILYDTQSRVVFLATRGGCLVTLPDCPQCVRARIVCFGPLASGRLEEDQLILTEADGTEHMMFKDLETEYRCTWSFALPYLQSGGYAVDLRQAGDPLPAMARVQVLPSDGWDSLPSDTPLFFFCESGVLADAAARRAREAGHALAYSLGGVDDIRENAVDKPPGL